MNRVAIEFDHVCKSFPHHAGRQLLTQRLKRLFQPSKAGRFQALKGISFQLFAGGGLAIVGSNGAGKSTLLSLASSLAMPDSGTVRVNGRITALLQLGSGFHPDLTGRENVILNAALLGLSRSRTAELFDEIVQFSEIADFLDEPLRTYSSGMVLRLAFSVAVCIDPDILIVDEILGVGDQAFQQKCQERITRFKNLGKTLLFVSHSAASVRQFCERAIWLDHGNLVMEGEIGAVLDAYQGRISSSGTLLDAHNH